MPLLILFPQMIRCIYLPLRLRRTRVKIKALDRLWIAKLRVKRNIPRHPLLPIRLADLLYPVCSVTLQLMGGIDPL